MHGLWITYGAGGGSSARIISVKRVLIDLLHEDGFDARAPA